MSKLSWSRIPALCVWICLGLCSARAANHPPVITNVTAAQRADATKWVDITYDLSDEDGDACTVHVLVSDDSGATWSVPAHALTGDVGGQVLPGTGRHIVWDPSADIPGVSGTQFKVRVMADDGTVPPDMVLIPGGEFAMGDHHDGMQDALPIHSVFIDTFRMEVYEVTNQDYCDYLNAAMAQGLINVTNGIVYKSGGDEPYCETHSHDTKSRILWDGSTFSVIPGKENHPMSEVSWYGAAAYANWKSSVEGKQPCYDLNTWDCLFGVGGYRLPTEAEWEMAARGGLSNPYRRYPWGDELYGSYANYWASGDPFEQGPYPWTTPIGYYNGNQVPPGQDMVNGYGLYDVAGDVWEWCNDWYDPTYYSYSPYYNPKGPSTGYLKVLRGGAWNDEDKYLRCAYRSFGTPDDLEHHYAGFRLVLD